MRFTERRAEPNIPDLARHNASRSNLYRRPCGNIFSDHRRSAFDLDKLIAGKIQNRRFPRNSSIEIRINTRGHRVWDHRKHMVTRPIQGMAHRRSKMADDPKHHGQGHGNLCGVSGYVQLHPPELARLVSSGDWKTDRSDFVRR